MICKTCHETVQEGVSFCPKCGSALNEASVQGSVQNSFTNTKDETENYSPEDIANNKVMGGLAYFLFFLPLIACPNSHYGKFHANQSLLLLITGILLGIVNAVLTSILTAVSWRLWTLASFISFILWVPVFILGIIGLINGFSGKAKELPVIGKFKIIK